MDSELLAWRKLPVLKQISGLFRRELPVLLKASCWIRAELATSECLLGCTNHFDGTNVLDCLCIPQKLPQTTPDSVHHEAASLVVGVEASRAWSVYLSCTRL